MPAYPAGWVAADYADWWRQCAREALKYADHHYPCAVRVDEWGTEEPGTCTCGLTELRRRVEEAK